MSFRANLSLIATLALLLCLVAPAAALDNRPVAKVISGADVFQGLDKTQLAQVAALGSVRGLAAGESFIHYGRHMKTIFVLASGRAEVILKDGSKVAECGPGTTLGEMELADKLPASATVRMMTRGSAVAVPMAALRSLMQVEPGLGYVVMGNVARKISAQLRARQ